MGVWFKFITDLTMSCWNSGWIFFNSNMSYRAWLCVKILRSYAGFQLTLVYELTSYTRWCLLNYLTHLFAIRSSNIWSMCDDDSLCVETILNLFKILDIMSCLNIGISIQVIITKSYVKYYLLILHTSICVITNGLLNTWTIHLINDLVY